MKQEKEPSSGGPSAGRDEAQRELSEQELQEIAGGAGYNPFAVTDQNGNIINVLHGEMPEGSGTDFL